jgi:hypothetical protein
MDEGAKDLTDLKITFIDYIQKKYFPRKVVFIKFEKQEKSYIRDILTTKNK